MITPLEAQRFAEQWIDAWNRHDLDSILDLYSEEIDFSSPFAAKLLGAADGRIQGRVALREFFSIGLAAYPDLQLKLRCVALGVGGITLICDSVRGLVAAHTMILDPEFKITQAFAHYA
jgi:hypothetical protein